VNVDIQTLLLLLTSQVPYSVEMFNYSSLDRSPVKDGVHNTYLFAFIAEL
jgi:hypothetical protein